MERETIFALASARGKSGVAVVRLSGSRAWAAVEALGARLPAPRQAGLRRLSHKGVILDEALVLVFEAGASYTGERVAELHLHGSTATISAVVAALGSMDGLRMAEPGEFTRRALENERLDLAQVEGLSDLIEAETEAQRRQALAVFEGALGRKIETWRADLVRAAALIEATIDFADEDVPIDVTPEVADLVTRTRASLEREIAGAAAAERIRDGFEVAIVGPPNVGKSTLLNYLAGREAAITSEIAGTTRDVIEVRMDLGGLPVTLLDTAGLRAAADGIEEIGVARAKARGEAADLRVFLTIDGKIGEGVERQSGDIVLRGKADLSDGDVSGLTGQGVPDLIARITEVLSERSSGAGVAIRERHRSAMQSAFEALGIALDRLESTPEQAEVVAEDLRAATRALESLTGRIDVEDLLDDIFRNFCIGK